MLTLVLEFITIAQPDYLGLIIVGADILEAGALDFSFNHHGI